MQADLQPGRVFDDIKNDQVQYIFMPVKTMWDLHPDFMAKNSTLHLTFWFSSTPGLW